MKRKTFLWVIGCTVLLPSGVTARAVARAA